jgi:hypothetical protein
MHDLQHLAYALRAVTLAFVGILILPFSSAARPTESAPLSRLNLTSKITPHCRTFDQADFSGNDRAPLEKTSKQPRVWWLPPICVVDLA